MALVPNVTNITAHVAAWTASGIINAVRAHIVSVDNVHLQVDAYTADEGLTIGYVAAGESHQFNLRKSGAQAIACSIEPSGSITVPGDSVPTAPTGTSADWSGANYEAIQDTSLGSPGAGSRVWIVELADAFFVMVTDTTNTFHVWGIHGGRICTSANSTSAPAAGQDGLGLLTGLPDAFFPGSNTWFASTSPTSLLHWQTNLWSDHVQTNSLGTNAVGNVAHMSYRPLPPPTLIAYGVNGSSTPHYGPAKYLRQAFVAASPKTLVVDGASNQAWMHYHNVGSPESGSLIWDKTKTP